MVLQGHGSSPPNKSGLPNREATEKLVGFTGTVKKGVTKGDHIPVFGVRVVFSLSKYAGKNDFLLDQFQYSL